MQIKLNLFVEAMQDAPVIAAVKNDEGLDRALSSGCTVVFLLYGTILNIGELVRRVKEAGKLAFIHIDLIEGMSARDISAEYIASRGRRRHLYPSQSDSPGQGAGTSDHTALFHAGLPVLCQRAAPELQCRCGGRAARRHSQRHQPLGEGGPPASDCQRAAAGQIRRGGGLVRRGGGGVHYQRETMVRVRATGASADIMATKSSYSALRTKIAECYWIISIY